MTGDQVDRTLWVGNLEPRVTEELLYELFVQAGPLLDVKIAKDKDGNKRSFAFIEYKHDLSIPYTIQLMSGIRLFDRQLNLQCRPGSKHLSGDNVMGRNSPLQMQEGRNSRPLTPDAGADMDTPNFHRSRSMPANLSSFGDQRRMPPHVPQRSHDRGYAHEYSHRPEYEDYGYEPQDYGHYRDYDRHRDYGRQQQDYGRHMSRNHLTPSPHMPRYRSPNMPPHHDPWQPSGRRGHYGYS